MPNDSTKKTFIVALALCLVCSLLVSTAAVTLKPLQESNQALDRKRNILAVAGLLEPGKDVDQLFTQVEARVVDLATGEYVETIDPGTYDQREAARDPDRNVDIPPERDLAGIGARAKYATVYLVRDNGGIKYMILPVHGYGLWSTLYGFLAIEGDAETVHGLSFYEHAETPGLGGEVDNPRWRKQWEGKIIYDAEGELSIEVVKGAVDAGSPEARYQVDGLAGATLTSRGITNLLHYWLGEQGFGPYLARIRSEQEA